MDGPLPWDGCTLRHTRTYGRSHQYVSRQNGRRLAQVSCVNPQTRDEKCICGSKLTHTELDICAPVGFGVNLTLRVSVSGRGSVGDVRWSFGKPKVTSA